MNVYDKAYELARAVKESDEFKQMKRLSGDIAADDNAKRMLDDFRAKQMEMQRKMIAGEMPAQEEMEKMQKLYEVIGLNPAIAKLFEAERRFSVVMEDVQRIIAEPLQDVMK